MEEWKSTVNFLRDRVRALEKELQRKPREALLVADNYEEALPINQEDEEWKERKLVGKIY